MSLFVAFHISRGGKFYNPGYKTFEGEMSFYELCLLHSSDLFMRNRTDNGRFCKPFLTDCSGNVVSYDNPNGTTGTLDFDGDYDTWYVVSAEDLSEEEKEIIMKSDALKSRDLERFLS
jgi:hypothetical protein|nr:MAG TPA_asm: hypothetical protein [Caudoviricetes sp.]